MGFLSLSRSSRFYGSRNKFKKFVQVHIDLNGFRKNIQFCNALAKIVRMSDCSDVVSSL